MEKEKLWTKEFIVVSAINFLITFMFFLLIVTIAEFAQSQFQASASIAGLATSTYFILFDIGLGVGPFLLGFLVPYVGYQMIFLYMVGMIIVTIPLYYLLHGKKDRELLMGTINRSM